MKKTVLITLAIACLCGAAHAQAQAQSQAQTSSVTLDNQEGATFYYLVDPPELAGLTAGSPLLSARVAEFFAAKPGDTSFQALAAGAQARISSLADGTHLLVGFFATEGSADFPVRVLSLSADSRMGNRYYSIFASPALIDVPRGQGRLVSFGLAGTGGTASATAPAGGTAGPSTTSFGTLATFADTYSPESFSREQQGDFSVLPISQSRGWGLTGTRISSVSAAIDGGMVKLALAAPEGFSEKVSYFFYVFDNRAPARASATTFELEPRADGTRGACLLWKQGAAGPKIVGSVKSDQATVEVDIPRDQITAGAGDSPTVDVTAGWYDRALGTWEEFYYTTFALEEIPVIR